MKAIKSAFYLLGYIIGIPIALIYYIFFKRNDSERKKPSGFLFGYPIEEPGEEIPVLWDVVFGDRREYDSYLSEVSDKVLEAVKDDFALDDYGQLYIKEHSKDGPQWKWIGRDE